MKKKRDIEGYIRKTNQGYEIRIVEYPEAVSPFYRERFLTGPDKIGYKTKEEAMAVIQEEVARFEYKTKQANIPWTKVEV